MFNRNIILASFALASVIGGSGAHAQISLPDDDVHQKVVSFSDLDLNDTAGAKTLMSRLQRAADDVCGRWDGIADRMGVNTCVREAVARAIKEVDKPALTALAENKPIMRIAAIGGSLR